MHGPVGQIFWTPGVSLETLEQQVIVAAFSFYRGNKTATAQSLGIAIRTLENKLDRYKELDKAQEERNEQLREKSRTHLERARGIHNGFDTTEKLAAFDRERKPVDSSLIGQSPQLQSQKPNVHQANERVREQPITNVAEKSAVSVPERKEVQSVLPKHASAGGSGKRR